MKNYNTTRRDNQYPSEKSFNKKFVTKTYVAYHFQEAL